jgi:DNA-binding HxlR family transcriptional regulator
VLAQVLILCWLKEGVHRFGELRRRIAGISERVLTQQLRELERDGIVHREVYPEVPPRVEYSLTDFGETLRPVMGLLHEWGRKHLKRIEER